MLLRSLLSNSDLLLQSTSINFLCKRCIQNIKIGIIGSGPAGFYTAQALLKDERVNIDIYEKYPVPFGLIRFGVAPDHQSVKNVIKSFTNTALNQRVTFYGNIGVGSDLSLKELRDAYHGIVLCYGASEDRRLNIEGEDLINVIPARRFVGWYNGIPQDADLKVNLNAESVVIVGHGNVALDCARILLSPVEEALKSTDITEHSLNALRESKVKTVYIVGRRGPLQVSFTIKELRELTKIPGVDTIVPKNDFEDLSPQMIESLPRPKKRLTEFLVNLAKEQNFHNNFKKCVILFQRSPLRILGNKKGEVDSVILGVNELKEEDGQIRAYPSGKTEEVRCGLFLRSIGFRALSIDESIPMDDKSGVIKNTNGKIEGVGEGLYCSGWAATGATGVILGTMNASFEIAGHILKDLEANIENLEEKPGSSQIIKSLQEKGVEVVTFQDWQRIDELERDIGMKKGKPREKLINQDEMVKVIKDKSL